MIERSRPHWTRIRMLDGSLTSLGEKGPLTRPAAGAIPLYFDVGAFRKAWAAISGSREL
jgi:hypothetical protein